MGVARVGGFPQGGHGGEARPVVRLGCRELAACRPGRLPRSVHQNFCFGVRLIELRIQANSQPVGFNSNDPLTGVT